MRLVTLQQCGKCPPASPVTGRRGWVGGSWASAGSTPLGTLLVPGALHPLGPIRLQGASFLGYFSWGGVTMLDPGAIPSSSLSVIESHQNSPSNFEFGHKGLVSCSTQKRALSCRSSSRFLGSRWVCRFISRQCERIKGCRMGSCPWLLPWSQPVVPPGARQ